MTIERSVYRALLLFGATVLVIWALGMIVWPFVIPIAWALCLAAVTYRLYRVAARKSGRPRLTAAAMVLTTALTILVPLLVVGVLVVGEARQMDLDPALERLRKSVPRATESINEGLHYFGIDTLHELTTGLQGRVPGVASLVLGGSPVKGALSIALAPLLFLFGLAVTLITQFFLYLEAPRLRSAVLDLSPLDPDDTDRILVNLRETTSASVLGGLAVAVIQGALGGIGFTIAGIDSPLVWAVVMMAFSLLPFGGTALVWAPAGLYLLVTGETWQGWFVLAWGALIVGASDNVVRPWILTKTGAENIHPLLLFFAIVSGIGLFGISGIVFGPLLLALLTTVMQIYREHWPRDDVEDSPPPGPSDADPDVAAPST